MVLHYDARSARRVPIDCPVKILLIESLGGPFYGTCTDLSVNGMTLQTSYVPRPEEELIVLLRGPTMRGLSNQPFQARVRVKRCHQLERDTLFELGVEIIEILNGDSATPTTN